MVFDPNANWTAAIASQQQVPVYFLRIDGLSAKDYSTHPVKSPTVTKVVNMDPPRGGAVALDVIDGVMTIQEVEVELADIDGEITDLVATEASGAPLSTLINRKATIYGGYRHLVETDYAAIFTGRITAIRSAPRLTGYVLTLSSLLYLLEGEIMTGATTTKPTTIQGNLVNVYWSILTGTFSTSDPDFPLETVSTDTGSSSAPTGLGIPTSLIDETLLAAQRDLWHETDSVKLEFKDPESAKAYLEDELFRVFQSWPAISGDGKLGLRFHVPALPAAAAPVVSALDHVLEVLSWERLYRDHLNKFRYYGDHNLSTDAFDATLYNSDTAEDTADRTATGETIEYLIESKWLRSTLNGAAIASELAGRQRIRYLKTPGVLDLAVTFARRNLEQGDVVALTDPDLPDLFTGSRGIDGRLLTVVSIVPDFAGGFLRVRLLDTGYKRYGVIAPESQANYLSATGQERNTFFFITNESGQMSNGDDGYRFI